MRTSLETRPDHGRPSHRPDRLPDRQPRRAHPDARRRHGHHDSERRPLGSRLPWRALCRLALRSQGQQRSAGAHLPRADLAPASRVPGGGADIVETNTFNSTRLSQADYGMEALVPEINREAARLARAACDDVAARTGVPRYVAGVLGPTSRTASLSPDVNDPSKRNVTFDALRENYHEAATALIEGGSDLILIETIFDTLNAKAAIYALEELFEERGERLPVMISGTITDASGRTLSGQTTEAFWNSVRHARPLSVGLNCALGAEDLRPYV